MFSVCHVTLLTTYLNGYVTLRVKVLDPQSPKLKLIVLMKYCDLFHYVELCLTTLI